jgi:hypothetical protein
VEDAELTARRKIEEHLDWLTATGHGEKAVELRKHLQVMSWLKWESEITLAKIRNPEGAAA